MEMVSDEAYGYGPRPDCYVCHYRNVITPGKTLAGCSNPRSSWELGIVCRSTGRSEGQFNWPHKFEPVWLLQCLGFKEQKETQRERIEKRHGIGSSAVAELPQELLEDVREALHDFREWWGSKEFWAGAKILFVMAVAIWGFLLIVGGMVLFLLEWADYGVVTACANLVERYAFW